MSNNEVFLSQLDNTLKELLLLGYGIIEDAYLLELDNLSQSASSIGFDALRALIENLYTACNNYLRINNDDTAMEVTKSIALLQFALANLKLGGETSNDEEESLERMLSALGTEQGSDNDQ